MTIPGVVLIDAKGRGRFKLSIIRVNVDAPVSWSDEQAQAYVDKELPKLRDALEAVAQQFSVGDVRVMIPDNF